MPFPSTEFSFLVQCCRWAFAGGTAEAMRAGAEPVRWERFIMLARRHRVQGIAAHCLRSIEVDVPADAKAELDRDAAAVAHQNLRATMHSAALQKQFSKAGIPLLFVKGLTVSKLAYGDALLKASRDLDILVAPDSIAAAIVELERLGYRLDQPRFGTTDGRILDWHRVSKESVWRGPDDHCLELHSRLADNPNLIAGIGLESPRQEVSVAPDIALPTLAPEELFAYLCVHGASSAWFRLKWITDLAALLHGSSPGEIERLYRASQNLGAGPAAGQALLLAARIYGTDLGPALDLELGRPRTNRWLIDLAWTQMTREEEPTAKPLGTVGIHLSQLLMLPGWKRKLGESARQLSLWRS